MSRLLATDMVYIIMNNVFSFASVSEFDKHIRNSISGFEDLTQDVIRISSFFINEQSHVIDIGCSTGKTIQSIGEKNNWKGLYTGIEIEKNFWNNFTERDKRINFVRSDVCEFEFPEKVDLILSIFTLQFLPRQKQANMLRKIYKALPRGGCFILCEKTYSDNSIQQELLTMLHYENKRRHFTSEQILDKEYCLRNMLTINTRGNLINNLKRAGFQHIDTFWQRYNFIGLMIVK